MRRTPLTAKLLIVAVGFLLDPAALSTHAQVCVMEERQKLTASDGAADDYFGTSLSINGDWAIIGAKGADNGGWARGSAYIFRRDDNRTPYYPGDDLWVESAKLTASDGGTSQRFGTAVSLSGAWAIVGIFGDNVGAGRWGAAYLFRRDDGHTLDPTDDVWIEVSKVRAPGFQSGDQFGSSVSISGDWAIVGAPFNNDGGFQSGSAYVFRRDDNGTPTNADDDTWVDVAQLTAADAAASDFFGHSVAIAGDRAIVGAYGDDDHCIPSAPDCKSGSAYVFRHDDNGTPSNMDDDSWIQETKLTASDADVDDWSAYSTVADYFGFSVALNGDHAIIGAKYDSARETRAGAAFLFRHDDNGTPSNPEDDSWIETQKLTTVDSGWYQYFGESVAIDGTRAIIGANDLFGTKAVYVYRRDDNATPTDPSDDYWVHQVKHTVPDVVDGFSRTVSISGDVALAGAFLDNNNAGSAFLYHVRLEGEDDDCNGNSIPDVCEADCNLNNVADSCDLASGTSGDCNGNNIPDDCEDCNGNLIADDCDIANGTSQDCTGNGVLDECEPDCNGNGMADDCDIADGYSGDCNTNGIPDECEDCNGNSIADSCDIADGTSPDCNANGLPDECEDCNGNGSADECDVADGTSNDCDGDGIPDECNADCNGNGLADFCDVLIGLSNDCNGNEIPDECEPDCNGSGFPDDCDIANGTSTDCTGNGVLDECEPDCNTNGEPDDCDIADGPSNDCNANTIPDECDLAGGTSQDCNDNDIPDECETDCNNNGLYDACDIAQGTSEDCQSNGIPDDCELDCDGNGVPDDCDLADGYPLPCAIIEFSPAGSTGPFQIEGNEIVIPAGDVQVEFEILISGWGNAPGSPLLLAYNLMFDGGSLLGSDAIPSNPGVDLATPVPVECAGGTGCPAPFAPEPFTQSGTCGVIFPGWCDDFEPVFFIQNVCSDDMSSLCRTSDDCPAGVGCVDNPRFIFPSALNPLLGVTYFADNWFQWLGLPLAFPDGNREDPDGVTKFVSANLRLIVPAHARGTYTMRFDPGANYTFIMEPSGGNIPSAAVYGQLTIGGACCAADLSCEILLESDCRSEGGRYVGGFCTGEVDQCIPDCNGNDIDDAVDIAGGVSPDCNGNGIPDECIEDENDCNSNGYPDECDVTDAISVDENGNGIPDECEANTNRYLALVRETTAEPVAYQVTLTASLEFPDAVGLNWWMDAPGEHGVSRLVGSPVYRSWNNDPVLIYIGDCSIVPVATYDIRTTPDGTAFSNPIQIATTHKPGIRYYGDVVGSGLGDLPPMIGFSPPNGVVNVSDVQAFLLTLQGPLSPSVPVVWLDLHGLGDGSPPDHILNVSDLQRILFGLEGKRYGDTPGQLSPADCP